MQLLEIHCVILFYFIFLIFVKQFLAKSDVEMKGWFISVHEVCALFTQEKQTKKAFHLQRPFLTWCAVVPQWLVLVSSPNLWGHQVKRPSSGHSPASQSHTKSPSLQIRDVLPLESVGTVSSGIFPVHYPETEIITKDFLKKISVTDSYIH